MVSANGGFVQGDAVIVIKGDQNSLLKSRIGTTPDGVSAIGSVGHGVQVEGSRNCIGARIEALPLGISLCGRLIRAPNDRPDEEANVISGNEGHGILLFGGGDNGILRNVIGLNLSQTAALGNKFDGILLTVGASRNLIRDNVISGNTAGIRIDPTSNDNRIEGNLIGTNGAGSLGLGNLFSGIVIRGASGNVVGGTSFITPGGPCTGDCNLISGNGGDGVSIFEEGATGNKVLGNYIGTDVTGTSILANDHTRPGSFGGFSNGVFLAFDASDNTIGGASAKEANVISGNHENGVHINGEDTSGNRIVGNRIGTDVTGTVPLGNGLDGVHVHGAPDNVIGRGSAGLFGVLAGRGNVISGNTFNGIQIHELGATGNKISGNLIGTDADGQSAVPNRRGVLILDAAKNTVGGDFLRYKNVISGNSGVGLLISGVGAKGNVVEGNYIGTNIDGTLALANGSSGVVLEAASENRIGVTTGLLFGLTTGRGNVISGNRGNGILIHAGAASNNVYGNLIGVDVNGTVPLGNADPGVFITAGSTDNDIGGVPVVDPFRLTTSLGNVIAYNGGDGVVVEGVNIGNAIRRNAIFSNGDLGIDIGPIGVTTSQSAGVRDAPVLTFIGTDGATIRGRLDTTPSSDFAIELFSNRECDPSGFGEGESFIRSITVTTDANGAAAFSTSALFKAIPEGHFVTATATDVTYSTSEFSQCKTATALTDQPGSIAGTVTLQGRTAGFPVSVGYSIASVEEVLGNAVAKVEQDGVFEFGGVLAGTYTLTASADGYLSAEHSGVGVELGKALTLPDVELRAGLVNSDNVVGIADITAIMDSLGLTVTNRRDAQDRVVDINGDGVVNILDMTAAASNFGKTSPQPWP